MNVAQENILEKSFTTAVSVEQSPEEVFAAVVSPARWWSLEIKGGTEKLNDTFDYHYKDVHTCKIKLTEVIPNKKVVWTVLENNFNFINDKTEWIGTQAIFEISTVNGKTQLTFTHDGLTAAYECYNVCKDAWTHYITESLYGLITTGKGQPNAKEGGFNAELAEKWNIGG